MKRFICGVVLIACLVPFTVMAFSGIAGGIFGSTLGLTYTFTGSKSNSSNWTTWQSGAGSAAAQSNGMYLLNGASNGDEAGMVFNSSFSLPSGSTTLLWRVKMLAPSGLTSDGGTLPSITIWQGTSLTFPGSSSGILTFSKRRLIAVLNNGQYAAEYTLANGSNINGSGTQIVSNGVYYVYMFLTSTQSRVVVSTSAVTDGSISQTFTSPLVDSGAQTIGGSGMTNDATPFWFQLGIPWTDTTTKGAGWVQEIYNHSY